MIRQTTKNRAKWLALSLLVVFLAACVPTDTGENLSAQAPSLESVREEPSPAVEQEKLTPFPTETAPTGDQPETAEPVRPTATPLPTLELMPTSPAKPVPTQEVFPVPKNPTEPSPDDPQLQKLIDKAKTDLAQRTGVPVEEITLYEFHLMTWPDASLGCPQPGMAYAQVTQDGYLIMLQAGLGIYNYHGGGYPDRGPFLCENGMGDKIIPPPPASIDQ